MVMYTTQVNFSTELSHRWTNLAAEEKEVYMQEASQLLAEYQQVLEERVKEEHERRQQMHALSIGVKRNRTQTEFLGIGLPGGEGPAQRLDDHILKRARKLQHQKRRLTKSWKAMVLQSVIALAPDFSTAAPLEEVIRKIGQLHPAFATKAEGKTKMLLDDLTKDGYVHVWCPGEILELEEEDVELQEPGEEEEGTLPPVFSCLVDAGAWQQQQKLAEGVGVPGSPALADTSLGDGGDDDDEGGFKSSKRRRSDWEKKAHYYAPEDAIEMLPEGDDIGPVRNREYPTEAEDRAAHNAEMRAHTADCDGRKASFVLNHWDKFAPFIAKDMRSRQSPLALKLQKAVDFLPQLEGKSSKARIAVHRQPDCIKFGEMHNYQLEGLKWLVAQNDLGAGGILGDEMGLGKTLQVISLLGFLKCVRGEDGPHIVVAPLSVMNNWVMEIKRWCPELRCVAFHGPQTERERIKKEHLILGQFDVMATTYEMLVADTHTCQRFHWGYIVLDEAHRIKNEKTLMGQAVRRLRSSHRLLITGTPLQNNMHELWSLLNFLYPEVLADSDTFDKEWKEKEKAKLALENVEDDDDDMEKEEQEGEVVVQEEGPHNETLLTAAHSLLRPLMLRRLKKDVLTSIQIPPKIELKIFVPLTEMQRFWYSGMLSGECANLAGAGSSDAYRRLNSLVMQLRKVCNHPYLFDEADTNNSWTDEGIVKASGKMIVLDKLLRKCQAEGNKVLIFSQFTSMLHVLSDFLNLRRYKFLRLDGSTSVARRRYEIACFQNPKSDFLAYLISTRAGGLGINLTAASTVVLYDSDWNPAIDSQAQDRAHRYGQKNPVSVNLFYCNV